MRKKIKVKIIEESLWDRLPQHVKDEINGIINSKPKEMVEVVKCEDCKWLDIYTINGEDITACNNENAFFRDVRCDEYCSCGERRKDG